MGDTQTDSKTSVSFHNVKVSSLNDDGEAVAKFAFNVNVTCEYDPEVSHCFSIHDETCICSNYALMMVVPPL